MVHEHLMAIYPYKLSHCKWDFCYIYRSAVQAQLQLNDLSKIKQDICGREWNQVYVFWITQKELSVCQLR